MDKTNQTNNDSLINSFKHIASVTGVYQATRDLSKKERKWRNNAMLALRRNIAKGNKDSFLNEYNLYHHGCIGIGKAHNGKIGPILTEKGYHNYFKTVLNTRVHWYERYMNDIKKYSILEPIKSIWINAAKTISSLDGGSKIAKYTGINHSTIYRLQRINANQGRRGTRHQRHLKGLEVTDIRTLLLLAAYNPKRTIVNSYKERVDKSKYGFYLYYAMSIFHFSPKTFKAKVAEVFSATNNISELSRRTGLRRLKLERINPYTRLGQHYDIWQLHPLVISAMLNEYNRLVELSRIIPKSKSKKSSKK